MNLKALITMLVLGSSSAVMAKPVVTVQGSVDVSWHAGTRSDAPVVRDHRHTTYTPAQGWYTRAHGQGRFENAQPAMSNVKLNVDSSEYIGPIYAKRTSGWNTLTDATHIEKSREIIRLNGRFTNLMLQNVSGASNITLVKIRFTDGTPDQVIQINQALNYRSNITFGVQRGLIDYITVYGTTNVGSSFRVLGS